MADAVNGQILTGRQVQGQAERGAKSESLSGRIGELNFTVGWLRASYDDLLSDHLQALETIRELREGVARLEGELDAYRG